MKILKGLDNTRLRTAETIKVGRLRRARRQRQRAAKSRNLVAQRQESQVLGLRCSRMLAADPQSVDDTREPGKAAENNIQQELGAASLFEEYSNRRQQDCKDKCTNVSHGLDSQKIRQITKLFVRGSKLIAKSRSNINRLNRNPNIRNPPATAAANGLLARLKDACTMHSFVKGHAEGLRRAWTFETWVRGTVGAANGRLAI